MQCASCGAELGEGARFCGACGAPAGAPVVPAPMLRRVLAWLVDVTIVWIVPIVIASVLIESSRTPSQQHESGQTGIPFLLALVTPIYSALLHRYWHGQTIGKRLLGIRVVSLEGMPIGLGQSVGRSYLRTAFLIAVFIPWLIDSIWPFANSRRRSLHDLATGTIVVRAG